MMKVAEVLNFAGALVGNGMKILAIGAQLARRASSIGEHVREE